MADANKTLATKQYVDDVAGSAITVDQTYNAESTNPQSGTAVAEAVEDKQDKFATVTQSDPNNPDYNKIVLETLQNIEFMLKTNNDLIVRGNRTQVQSTFNKIVLDDTETGNPISVYSYDENTATLSAPARIRNIADPINNSDAVNKQYTDDNFSNALKGSVSGETFLLDDVSPISQDISVKVSGESISDLTTVKVQTYGKNLIPFPYSGLPAGTGTITINGVTFTVNEDGSVLVNGTAEANAQFNLSTGAKINTVNGVTYTLSGCPSGGSTTTYLLRVYAGSYTFQDVGNGNIHVTIGEDTSENYSYIAVRQGTIVNNLLFKPQFAVEDKVTEYEPYIAPTEYTPNSDGTVDGVTVIYPNTTFMTDTAGAIVDCEYNRDINKAYSSLLQRVAALEAAALNNV